MILFLSTHFGLIRLQHSDRPHGCTVHRNCRSPWGIMVIEASRRATQKTRWEGGIPIPSAGQGSVVAGPNHRLMVFTHLLLTAPSIDLAKTNRPGQSMTAKRMLVTHAKAAPLVIENWVHTRPLNPSTKTTSHKPFPFPFPFSLPFTIPDPKLNIKKHGQDSSAQDQVDSVHRYANEPRPI